MIEMEIVPIIPGAKRGFPPTVPVPGNGNADRDEYFDKKLYAERYAVERTNAWMGSYRSLPNRSIPPSKAGMDSII
jgi:hypothetical protein